jgi:hypothetical protein
LDIIFTDGISGQSYIIPLIAPLKPAKLIAIYNFYGNVYRYYTNPTVRDVK